MNLFYVPDITSQAVKLPDEEARHCVNVLRYNTGQQLQITDGKGAFYTGVISTIKKKEVWVAITDKTISEAERGYKLHMAVAPTKNINRYEWFLEKATEIGVDEITPIITRNSERTHLRTDRLEKVIISAMKQSLKSVKPVLNEPVSLQEFQNNSFNNYVKYIAYCGNVDKLLLHEIYQKDRNVVFLIGPEGDFDPDEVLSAVQANFQPVTLGESRLRTETAAIAATHAIYMLNQQ